MIKGLFSFENVVPRQWWSNNNNNNNNNNIKPYLSMGPVMKHKNCVDADKFTYNIRKLS